MLFNSLEFALFLPIVFVFYWFVFGRSLRWQNLFVVVASYVFYGWWDWRFLLLIALTSFCSWGSGLLIAGCECNNSMGGGKDSHPVFFRSARFWLWANILLNLGILGFFKYFNFFVQSFADALALAGLHLNTWTLHVILPVGISFYTFQALSYSIDVYKGKLRPTRDIVAFFAYVSFFPQLVAGPIERATNLLPQFTKPRVFDYGTAVDGCRQMLWGLFKKVVVADNCAVYVDTVFGDFGSQSGSTLLLAAVLFTFQIYGDFSGYSDIAIGCAKLFGISLMRNFNVPYFSRDIAEFWRRWHISLTTWFRDYIYIPLGGSRCGKWKMVRNTFVIFLVSGLWHGANWTYVLWGLYHALLFLPLILLGRNRRYRDVVAHGRLLPSIGELVQMFCTFMLVVFGWIIFRSGSIGEAWQYVCGICDSSLLTVPWLKNRVFYISTFFVICLLLLVEWFQRNRQHGLELSNLTLFQRIVLWLCFVELIVLFRPEVLSQFIYFQF